MIDPLTYYANYDKKVILFNKQRDIPQTETLENFHNKKSHNSSTKFRCKKGIGQCVK